MTDLSNLVQYVANALKDTKEYREYEEAREELSKDNELFRRVNEMRQKNFLLQQENSDNLMELMDALTNEYEDVINLELTGRFLEAEADVCRMVQEFNNMLAHGLEFE